MHLVKCMAGSSQAKNVERKWISQKPVHLLPWPVRTHGSPSRMFGDSGSLSWFYSLSVHRLICGFLALLRATFRSLFINRSCPRSFYSLVATSLCCSTFDPPRHLCQAGACCSPSRSFVHSTVTKLAHDDRVSDS